MTTNPAGWWFIAHILGISALLHLWWMPPVPRIEMAATGLTYEQLEEAFRAGRFEPLYLLYGEELFLADSLQQLLIEHALQPFERDFNLDLIYGAEAEAQAVLGHCSAFPMMAERRVVIVRDFDKLKGNNLFETYAENPNRQAVVLLICSGRPNLNNAPYRKLKARAIALELKSLSERQLPAWLERRARHYGLKISAEAAGMLAAQIGSGLQNADAELTKLRSYIGDRTAITPDDVIAAGGHSREFNVFELQKAVAEHRKVDAYRITERLLQQTSNSRGEALAIVAVLSNYFGKLWRLAACRAAGVPERDLPAKIGVPPFFLKDYLQGLRRTPLPALDGAFLALLAADFELKGGSTRNEKLILDLLYRRLIPAKGTDRK